MDEDLRINGGQKKSRLIQLLLASKSKAERIVRIGAFVTIFLLVKNQINEEWEI